MTLSLVRTIIVGALLLTFLILGGFYFGYGYFAASTSLCIPSEYGKAVSERKLGDGCVACTYPAPPGVGETLTHVKKCP